MARTIHAAWCAFIRGEPPNAPGLPAWPRYSPVTRPTMILNTVSRVEDAPQASEFALWSGLMTQ
jgi:para-nitrobenzyl esterase